MQTRGDTRKCLGDAYQCGVAGGDQGAMVRGMAKVTLDIPDVLEIGVGTKGVVKIESGKVPAALWGPILVTGIGRILGDAVAGDAEITKARAKVEAWYRGEHRMGGKAADPVIKILRGAMARRPGVKAADAAKMGYADIKRILGEAKFKKALAAAAKMAEDQAALAL